jgi:hypothetical protein
MSNVVYLDMNRPAVNDGGAADMPAALPALDRAEELCTTARDALTQLAEHFELAIHRARIIEPQISDPDRRLQFAHQIACTERLLGAAQRRIMQL